MGRWADQDNDSERLPEGFERIGYDADSQTYTFRDRDGAIYESAPGNRYGTLRPTGDVDTEYARAQESRDKPLLKSGDDEERAELAEWQHEARRARRQRRLDATGGPFDFEEASNRQAMKMMLPFVLLVLVFLLALFKFLMSASADEVEPQVHCVDNLKKVEIQNGETCWEIAKAHSLTVDELIGLGGNEKVDCEALRVGQQICVPN